MPVLDKTTGDEIEKFKKASERRKTFHEETSRTIKWTINTLIATCLFCVVTLFGTSDVHLLTPDSKIKLPILNYDMSFVAFLVVGPIVIIGLVIYLHIFVGQQRIAMVPGEEKIAILSNFENKASQEVVHFLLYLMVPITLIVFAWKAKPREEGYVVYLAACIVFVGLVYLYCRRCPKERRALEIATWLFAVVLFIYGTAELIRLRHISLFKADLHEQDLRGANLELAFLLEANLENSNLIYANLRGADLRDANLKGANLDLADLRGADLSDADLQGADLFGADLQEASLFSADLQGANLNRADLQGANLSGADLQGADLFGADLQEASLFSADLQGASLFSATLQGADLFITNLKGADLRGVDLRRNELSATFLQGANLSGANLQGASLSGANLQGANLSGADLRGAVLFGADLQGANLSGADLQGANLRSANLQGADFSATLLSATPYRNPLSRENLMGALYNAFSWSVYAQSGAFYRDDYPPNIDPSLLVYFTAVGDECTWFIGMEYVECAGHAR